MPLVVCCSMNFHLLIVLGPGTAGCYLGHCPGPMHSRRLYGPFPSTHVHLSAPTPTHPVLALTFHPLQHRLVELLQPGLSNHNISKLEEVCVWAVGNAIGAAHALLKPLRTADAHEVPGSA